MTEQTNINDLLNTSISAQLVHVVQDALLKAPVMVYNGQDTPTEHEFGPTMTLVTYEIKRLKGDVSNVSTIVAENTELLSNIRERKKIMRDLSNTFSRFVDYIGLTKKWKIILFVMQTIGAIYGFYQILFKILGD